MKRVQSFGLVIIALLALAPTSAFAQAHSAGGGSWGSRVQSAGTGVTNRLASGANRLQRGVGGIGAGTRSLLNRSATGALRARSALGRGLNRAGNGIARAGRGLGRGVARAGRTVGLAAEVAVTPVVNAYANHLENRAAAQHEHAYNEMGRANVQLSGADEQHAQAAGERQAAEDLHMQGDQMASVGRATSRLSRTLRVTRAGRIAHGQVRDGRRAMRQANRDLRQADARALTADRAEAQGYGHQEHALEQAGEAYGTEARAESLHDWSTRTRAAFVNRRQGDGSFRASGGGQASGGANGAVSSSQPQQ